MAVGNLEHQRVVMYQHMTNKTMLTVLAVITALASAVADDATLSWSNGDSLKGALVSADQTALTWRSELFADPLQIELSALSAVTFPKSEVPQPASDGFRILMRNGDVLSGDLKAIRLQTLSFEGLRFGAFEVARNQVLGLQRATDSGGLIYSGPRGLEGWQPAFRRAVNENNPQPMIHMGFREPGGNAPPEDAEKSASRPASWTEEPNGSLSTVKPDAAVFLPLTLPGRFEIELELTTKKYFSFVMSVGRDAKSGLRLETWVDVLVAGNGAKFQTLKVLNEDDRVMHLHVFVDYESNAMTVYTHAGQKLGEVSTVGLRGGAEGLLFRNGDDDLTLRRLRVTQWDGKPPRIVTGNGLRIQLADDTVRFGTIEHLNSASGLVRILENGNPAEIPLADITSIVVTGDDGSGNSQRGASHVVWNDGSFVSGDLTAIRDGSAIIVTAYSMEPLRCELVDAVRIGLTGQAKESAQTDRMFFAGGSLQGSLVVDGEASQPIQWKPLGGLNAVTLKSGGDARFLRGSGVRHFSESPEQLAEFPDVIYLTNGDVLPCRIEACSEESVQLTSPFSDVRTFAKAAVRAVELAAAGRVHQSGFGAEGWKGIPATQKKNKDKLSFKGNAGFSHPSILTGDTIRFHLQWPQQSFANLTVSLFGSGKRTDKNSSHVAFGLMHNQVQVLDRPPEQNQMMFRGGFGRPAVAEDGMVRVTNSEADIQIVIRDGNLLVSVDDKLVKTVKLNPTGVGSRGVSFNANVQMMGNVIVNGQVQQRSGDGIDLSNFEIDNLAGTSIRQFIEEETRETTLLVPRFRHDNPPTHVLLAPNGDLLRGRLLSIGEKDVEFESRLENLRIVRNRVSAIVWLNLPPASSIETQTDETAVNDDPENGFVMEDEADSSMQAHLADGFSITLTPERLVNGHIEGQSDLLGKCSFPAASIRELFLGNPEGRESLAAYEQWNAQHAKEPDWDIAQSDGGNSAGAAMIGKPAEDFELPMLDGSTFRLKDHGDKIVVLDFWATWCGPCVAALPDYVAATAAFDSSKVIFVAVNQQETADQVREFLSEQKLSVSVALDRSAAVSQKFAVSGIPHTVIIGPGGVIEDVHVGYQAGSGEVMQETIQKILDGTWKRLTPGQPPAQIAPPESI